MWRYWALAAIIIFFVFIIGFVVWQQRAKRLTSTPAPEPSVVTSPMVTPSPGTVRFATKNNELNQSTYDFSVEVPTSWKVSYIEQTDALNFFDPNGNGDTNLERSQIFVRSFRASGFETLSTVTIHNREAKTYRGRSAFRYDIEKKSNVANFPFQPSWRNQRHIVTDIRTTEESPALFYVIAKRPDLNEAVYQQFLESLILGSHTESTWIAPIEGFTTRNTKKNFGLYVTPNNSPISPEKFTGYHTGVDIEYGDVTTDVPVKAVAAGTVKVARFIDGYGGLVGIEHDWNDKKLFVVYGHLDPKSLVKENVPVAQGDIVGVLGDKSADETDNERKHLHFGVRRSADTNLRGYSTSAESLRDWFNPYDLIL
jgi:murein DD-endopeptidase MepM/ murein hydrolase activator NlpD